MATSGLHKLESVQGDPQSWDRNKCFFPPLMSWVASTTQFRAFGWSSFIATIANVASYDGADDIEITVARNRGQIAVQSVRPSLVSLSFSPAIRTDHCAEYIIGDDSFVQVLSGHH
ncbi:uncharacterized protein ARMOST_07144 [Armillaria ostoyae]|uniref:Uncharacterized protein n=1 Tax=Armillaria ostoyae TaxID=47428 RepID=A0A284R4Y7_ARMOS|nr:uncharacterized protein ARMOST_07144 [Armillaria ostoyae]